MELTDFQIKCEKQLAAVLQQLGERIINRRIDGQSERFIVGDILGRDITFWIYTDGADFRAPHKHPTFEKPDFDSLNELGAEFTRALVKAAQE